MKKEILKPNEVAATLFVGVGGIGSKIIKRVADLAAGDNTEAVRFVTMDTDVNDLEMVERGNKVIAIQTSSPRSVRDYLDSDLEAAQQWFPVNNILDDKTVSEGAGQVRAISRLALNATIRNGKIRLLYNAIDDLFLKNGASKCQALKVVIASTAAGGTGSGIAMEVGMLIRHYIKKKYPESACIIRGFLLLPGVMDTVVDNDTERDSLRRNGYATIKEINAFMMKGSGFFKSEPRLARYKDLSISIPTTDGGYERLDYLPFDFCFLLDRTDGIQKSMKGLAQYREYAAQSIYEQNIGPMRFSASSKEDNVIKEFSDPKKLGRCRFGGAGAATVRYPYAKICDFIALDWAQQLLFGKVDAEMDEETRERMIERTWLKYDVAFERKFKEWESTPGASSEDEPTRCLVYTQTIEESLGGKGDNFSDMLFDKYLKTKVAEVVGNAEKDQLADSMEEVVESYLQAIVSGLLDEKIRPMLDISDEDLSTAAERASEKGSFGYRYDAIKKLRDTCDYTMVRSKAKQFVRGIFESRASVGHGGLKDYMIQRYLSNNGAAIHPNAVRYLLYKLKQGIQDVRETINVNTEDFEQAIRDIIANEKKKKMYELGLDGQAQETLLAMCQGIDSMEGVVNLANGSKPGVCNNLLDEFYSTVIGGFQRMAKRAVCDAAEHYVDALIAAYEKFYNTFRDKSVSIVKRKEAIREELRFRKGDCLLNLFSDPGYLDMLAEQNKPMGGTGAADLDMFIRIYDMVRENSEIEEHNRYDEFSDEQAHDVFEEVMVGYFRELVEKQCSEELDVDILHAIKLQFKIKNDLAKRDATEEEKAKLSKQLRDPDALRMYINKILNIGRNLATPGICKKSFDESRDVNAVAYSIYCKDGGGIRVADYFDDKNASDSVSRYEARFFRSIYVIMPTQIFQFCAPRIDQNSTEPRVDLIDSSTQNGAGESFLRYQTYMEGIGPDSRMNSIITPHVDTRWNSISVMPELDLEYQDQLMKHIQKAFVYGFLYGVIGRYAPSRHDPKRFLYRYRDGRNGFKQLIVSNKTKCDKLYEVLDALYFDRAAVTSIHTTIAQSRDADEKRSATYDNTIFKNHVNNFTRAAILGDEDDNGGKASLFELVLLYFNSLPPRQRDAAEIEVMVDAIMEVVQTEVAMFTEECDKNSLLGILLAEQYNLLNKNYRENEELLGMGIAMRNNDVMMIIRRKVEDKLFDLDITMPELASME